MHLRQPQFIYSTYRPFTKNKERIQKLKERKCIYKNELDETCFQYDMAYGDFKNLARKTAADKALRDKAFNIAKNPKYDGYQRGLVSMVYEVFDKKTSGSGVKSIPQNQQLAKELQKPIIKNFEKEKCIHHSNS